ncbi:hypothetical protein B0A55_09147 [Friedmanniomyces simplex]|uniref:Uncharacterized protein n=1 Tax=Friedmanniomyces simplex TaxID=329884 RepID=A0A4V5NEI4_9PEZI|nr:hypothetical protein B0A55_09147 [Friedmanniomyces simplex]
MALGKRKRASIPPINLDTFATQLKADPTRLSLLLDLLPELRNIIYEYVFASTGGVLLSRQLVHRALAPKTSTLLRVNKQIHTEFLHAAWLLADIHTTALEYDFRHIVTFLNRHEEEEIRALPSTNLPQHRTIFVEIQPNATHTQSVDDNPKFLKRWLNRAEHPTKKGTRVHYEYRLRPGYAEPRWPRWRVRAQAMEEGRKREELEKIIAAVR